MKKPVLGIALFFLVSVALIWAGGGQSTTQTTTGRKKITVEIFERNQAGLDASNNWATKWIQQNWGDPRNADIEFIPIPRAQEIDMLNILMAANNAPDLCYTYTDSVVYSYVQGGGLYALDDLLKTPNGVTVSNYLTQPVLAWGRWNGNQYAMPARRMDIGATATFIRKDWLDKLGLPLPTTFDEFYNAITAFKQKDPGGVGNLLIPFAMEAYDPSISWSAATILDAYLGPMSQEDLATTRNVEFARPGIKEGLRYLNKLYH